MEFGIEECVMLIKVANDNDWRMEQPNQDKIRTIVENETYKYIGILGADTIK